MTGPELPAGLGWRMGARIVDLVVIGWLVAFVFIEIDQRLLGGDPLGRRPTRLDLDSPRQIVLLVLLLLAYEVIPTAMLGATPGKALFGLRVRCVGEGMPIWLAASARAVALYLPTLFLGRYGLLMLVALTLSLAVPASGRGLHDRLAGTVVITLPGDDDE